MSLLVCISLRGSLRDAIAMAHLNLFIDWAPEQSRSITFGLDVF